MIYSFSFQCQGPIQGSCENVASRALLLSETRLAALILPVAGTRPQSLTIYALIRSLLFSLPQNCHWQKISPLSSKRGFNWFSRPWNVLFRKFEARTLRGEGKKEHEIHLHPASGKLLLTFNLFQQEMGSYIVTTVNRRAEERGAIRQDCQL